MSAPEEENKAHYRRTFEEVFNQGNLALVDELVAPDYLNYEVPPGRNNRGHDSTRQSVRMLRAAFPDLHFTIEDLVAEGDTVAGRVTVSGTHLGPFQGIPPTGRSFQQAQMHFVCWRRRQGHRTSCGARRSGHAAATRCPSDACADLAGDPLQ